MTPDPDKAALLMKLVEGIEIDSADGRAGVRAILREIEAAAPTFILACRPATR